MKILDKNRPYGTICGGSGGGCFEQDGVIFNSKGEELNPPIAEKKVEETPQIKAITKEREVIDLAQRGQSPKEIRKKTAFHHKTIERILKNADVKTDGGLD